MRSYILAACMLVVSPYLLEAQNTPADFTDGGTTWTYVGTYITKKHTDGTEREIVWIAQHESKILPDGTPRIIVRIRQILESIRDGATISGDAPIHGITFVNVDAYTCEVDHARRRTVMLSSVAYDRAGHELVVLLEDTNPDDPSKWWINAASDSATHDDGQKSSRKGDAVCALVGFQ